MHQHVRSAIVAGLLFLMKAMRMTYPVADAKLLEGLSAGDSIQGKLKAGSRSYTITSLEKR